MSGMNVSNAQVGVKPHLALKTRETRHSIMMRLPATRLYYIACAESAECYKYITQGNDVKYNTRVTSLKTDKLTKNTCNKDIKINNKINK